VLLKGLPALRELSLDTTNVGDEAVPALASMAKLETLNLYHTLVTQAGLEQLKTALPKAKIVWDRDSALPNRRRT
jgi:hypothetical protein